MILKAISLWQPWASLWLTNCKKHETRSYNTKYRGPLLVHAALREPDVEIASDLDAVCDVEFGVGWRERLSRGAIIGAVNLLGVFPTETQKAGEIDRMCGDWTAGRWAWLKGASISFPPIPVRGMQGMWSVEIPDTPTMLMAMRDWAGHA